MDTKLVKVQTYRERLPQLNPHDQLIMWKTQGHVAIWKVRFMTTKLGRVLNSTKRFRTQILKSLPTSCLNDGYQNVFFYFVFILSLSQSSSYYQWYSSESFFTTLRTLSLVEAFVSKIFFGKMLFRSNSFKSSQPFVKWSTLWRYIKRLIKLKYK